MNPMKAGISVVIPTWRRPAQLVSTVERILECSPSPSEILVHVDAFDSETPVALRERFGEAVKIMTSSVTVGPGGGRNRLLEAANELYFASFDDDSWPICGDYFKKALSLLDSRPDAGIIGARVSYALGFPLSSEFELHETPSFEGCGHVGRCEVFREIPGYVPLRYAYGMEEVDVSLQLLDRGWRIFGSDSLVVFHDTCLEHHVTPGVNGSQIRNTALKAFLRYPVRFWPLGLLQTLNRVFYSIRKRRFRGILSGVLSIPFALIKYARFREVVSPETVRLYRKLSKV